eukprot:sb/3466349/
MDPDAFYMSVPAPRKAPTVGEMLTSIDGFAASVLGTKYQGLAEVYEAAHFKGNVPGTSEKELDKLGKKSEVCVALEKACSLIFCNLLPGINQLFANSVSLSGQIEDAELAAKEAKEATASADLKKELLEMTSKEAKASADLKKELLELQRDVIRLQREVIKLKDEVQSADRSTFSTTVKKELKCYSTVLSQNCAAAVAPRRLEAALKKATSPDTSEIDRSKNLMLFGLPESENEDATSTKSKVSDVLSRLESTPVVSSTTRKSGNRPRPIKVTLESREDLILLLKKAKLLRQDETYRHVYLSPDLTKVEREENNRVYKTLKQLRMDNPGRKYFIRGGSIMFDV